MWYQLHLNKAGRKLKTKQKQKNKIFLLPEMAEAPSLRPLTLGSRSKGFITTFISMRQVAETPEMVAYIMYKFLPYYFLNLRGALRTLLGDLLVSVSPGVGGKIVMMPKDSYLSNPRAGGCDHLLEVTEQRESYIGSK